MAPAGSCKYPCVAKARAGMLLAGVVLLVYGTTCGFGWLDWDDGINVTRNPGLNPVTLTNVAGFWSRPYQGLYIPVSYTFFAGEVLLSRAIFSAEPDLPPDPRPFHTISVLLHACCVLLVWRLIVSQGSGTWPALAGALLFAVHPLQVESVAWISEQRGLLATALSLAAMLFHLRTAADASPSRRPWTTCAGLVCFGLATLAKPQAIVVPLLLIILESRKPHWSILGMARSLWPWFVMSVAVGVITKLQQPSEWSWSGAAVAPLLRPFVAGDALCFYAGKLLLPIGLCIDYGRTPAVVLDSPWLCLRAAAALGALAGIWITPGLRSCRVPIGLALAGLLPVLGFVPFTFQGFSTVTDRYAYLPMLGPALGLAFVLTGPKGHRAQRLLQWGVCLWLLVLAGLAIRQASVWRSPATVNAHAVLVNPHTSGARLGLAASLIAEDRLVEAADVLRRAVELNPDYAKAQYELGSTLHKLGKSKEAEVHYRAALRLKPGWAYVHNDLGILLAQQGRSADAVIHFREAVALRPDLPASQRNLEQAEHMLSQPSGPQRQPETGE